MAMRSRSKFRRRRFSRMRWFTPALWSHSNPAPFATHTVPSAGPYQQVAIPPGFARVLSGTAPFQGVNNSAGILTGRILAERQYYNIRRIVGRMEFFLSTDSPLDMESEGGAIRVFWALLRMHTDELGQPDEKSDGTAVIDVSESEDQDEKAYIIAQDVWTTAYPIGTQLAAGTHSLAAAPPLYSLIDKTMRRSFRNEQDLFLATSADITTFGGNGIPSNTALELRALVNLRPLGTFGR